MNPPHRPPQKKGAQRITVAKLGQREALTLEEGPFDTALVQLIREGRRLRLGEGIQPAALAQVNAYGINKQVTLHFSRNLRIYQCGVANKILIGSHLSYLQPHS